MQITLKSVKIVKGHDDSQPFTGILVVDGKNCAELFDDGWGGGIQIDALPGMQKTLEAAMAYAKTLPPDMDLELLIGDLCEPIFKAMDEKKAEAKLKRLIKNNLVFIHGNDMVTYKFKHDISVIAKQRPDIIEQTIAKAKAKYPEYVLYNKL